MAAIQSSKILAQLGNGHPGQNQVILVMPDQPMNLFPARIVARRSEIDEPKLRSHDTHHASNRMKSQIGIESRQALIALRI